MRSRRPTTSCRAQRPSLEVLQTALLPIGRDDLTKQTPCRAFDVAALTDDSVDHRVVPAARTALDAWRRRGLDGTVSLGGGEMPASMVAGIWSIEFLVHGWDFATAMGRDFDAPEPLSAYVLELSQKIITPEGRSVAGFDPPVDLPYAATAFEKLLAHTGRDPMGYRGL